jgi:carbon monoxide dehydrogenase subunit G
MRMTGEERIAVPRNQVWAALNDPDVLRQCIPGCLSLEREAADRLRATVEVKIGPIGARFNSTIAISNSNPPQAYTITGEGQGGMVGSARSSINVRLAENGAETLLSYDVDAQVGGRLAQLGGPLIDATAKQFAAKFFKRFGEIITGAGQESVAAAAAGAASQVTSAVAAPVRAPLRTAVPSSSNGFPIAWILALVVAALVGFLVGRGQSNAGGSDWMGLSIGLLVMIVAAAGFEFGRRTAAPPQWVIDAESLQRLLRGDKS